MAGIWRGRKGRTESVRQTGRTASRGRAGGGGRTDGVRQVGRRFGGQCGWVRDRHQGGKQDPGGKQMS